MSRLGERTWNDLTPATDPTGADLRPILALPIGSCEQHGPHLPLETDTLIAVAIAERLADTRTDTLVAPALTVTASGEHAGFPGTLSIGTAATELVLIELVRSADWSRGVVFVNGHGGNAAAVRGAVRTLTAEGRIVLDWWPRISTADAHAGRTETSLLLAIAPHLVRLGAAMAGNTASIATLSSALMAGGVVAVSPNGVLGDPAGASVAEGVDLLDALVADLADRMRVAWPCSGLT